MPEPLHPVVSKVVRSLAAAIATAAAAAAQEPAGADDAALVARARALHARVLTLDTHKDISPDLALDKLPEDPTLRERFVLRTDPTVRGSNQVDFPKMREGGYDCAFFIVYVGQGALEKAAFERATAQAMLKFDAIDRMVARYPDDIGLATTPAQVRELHSKGKLIACIGIENGYVMGEDLALIERFHARGARYMSLTHNRHSQLGDSNTPAEPLHGGLSDLGRKAIAEMNRVGIMVDVSHAAKSTTMQAIELSTAPVLASHSGARSKCDHTRNLDDEELRALAQKGGVIQCVAFASYVRDDTERQAAIDALRKELGLAGRRGNRGGGAGGADPAGAGQGDDDKTRQQDLQSRLAKYDEGMRAINTRLPRANVHDFVDHIDHAVKVCGIDHVGISSDFDGGGGIDGWNDASETPNVTIELVRRGYTEEQIGKLWSGNLLRLWEQVEAHAAAQRAAVR